MNLRVQRFDPPVHHFRKSGEIGHIRHIKPRLTQGARRSARADQRDAMRHQRVAEIHKPGFVGYGQQGASDGGKIGLGVRFQSGFFKIRLVHGQVAHGNGSFLSLGQGPAHARGIGIGHTGQNDLLGRARLQARHLKIGARL